MIAVAPLAYSELARRYFSWIGPATPAEFQWFSALGVKAVKAAVEPLRLVPLADGDARLMFAKDRVEFESFKIPKQPLYVLVSSIDGVTLLRRDLKGLLAPQDFNRSVMEDKGVKPAGGLLDLPSHGIFDRGRLVGLWEYDPASESIAWTSFGIKDKALDEAVRRTEQYVRAQLGDARSFSLDSPKSRVPRIEALRKAAGN